MAGTSTTQIWFARSIVALVVFASGMSARAAEICHATFSTDSGVATGTKIDVLLDAPEALKAELESTFLKADRFFGRMNVSELRVFLSASLPQMKSAYDTLTNTLHIGVSGEGGKIALPIAFVLHESGHPVFERFFHLQVNGKSLSLTELAQNTARSVQAKQFELLADPEFMMANMQLQEARQIVERLEAEGRRKEASQMAAAVRQKAVEHRRKFLPELYAFTQLKDFVIPYNELFADLRAALFVGDGKAMVTGHYSYEHNTDAKVPRDFTELHNFKSWKNEAGLLKAYTDFDPVRGALWRLLQTKIRRDAKPEAILEAFIKAAEEHVALRQARGENIDVQRAPSVLNQEFLRLFVNQARALGIWQTSPRGVGGSVHPAPRNS